MTSSVTSTDRPTSSIGLLDVLGYGERDGVWRHPERTAVFVGDLIDRGPQQLETIGIVRPMVSAGSARIVLGNHEFNAIAYATPDPANPGEYLRTRYGDDDPHARPARGIPRRRRRGLAAPPRARRVVQDFPDVARPRWPARGRRCAGTRARSRCWRGDTLTAELIEASSRKGTPAYAAVEIVLKGPEIELGEDRGYFDPDDDWRTRARFRWWDPEATTLRRRSRDPRPTSSSCPTIPSIRRCQPYADDVPVIVGHYWRTGEPTVITDKVACVDYSAAKGGPLVAYRWSKATRS